MVAEKIKIIENSSLDAKDSHHSVKIKNPESGISQRMYVTVSGIAIISMFDVGSIVAYASSNRSDDITIKSSIKKNLGVFTIEDLSVNFYLFTHFVANEESKKNSVLKPLNTETRISFNKSELDSLVVFVDGEQFSFNETTCSSSFEYRIAISKTMFIACFAPGKYTLLVAKSLKIKDGTTFEKPKTYAFEVSSFDMCKDYSRSLNAMEPEPSKKDKQKDGGKDNDSCDTSVDTENYCTDSESSYKQSDLAMRNEPSGNTVSNILEVLVTR